MDFRLLGNDKTSIINQVISERRFMKIKKENLDKSRIKFEIEVEPKELGRYFRAAYEKAAVEVKVDGFRPGKVPYKMVLETLGYNRLLSEGIEQAIQESYLLALKENDIFPISQAKISYS